MELSIAFRPLAERFRLGRAAHGAIKWLSRNREQFVVGADKDSHADHEAALPWRIKPLGELVFMLIMLHRKGISSRELRALTTFALDECEKFDWQMLASFDPSAASPVATVIDFFRLNGRTPPIDIDYIGRLNSLNYFSGMDRIPYRYMDVLYSYSRIGWEDHHNELATSFALTPFGKRQIISRYSIDDIYSLTHSLFYLSDIGNRPLSTLLDLKEVERIRKTLYRLIAIMIRSDNCDVLGELLLCARLCGFKPQGIERAIYRVGTRRMLHAQARHGSIASTEGVRLRDVDGKADFRELYHTTLVGALMLSLRWDV